MYEKALLTTNRNFIRFFIPHDDDDGWEKLCEFLNQPIPKVYFPNTK